MFNQVLLSIGRKLSAHLFTTCIFCILILIVLIGGLIQIVSSVAFSAYLDNSNDQQEVTISPTAPFSVLSFDGSAVADQIYDVQRQRSNNNNKNATSFGKDAPNSIGESKSSGNHASSSSSFGSSMKNDHDDKMTNGFLSTKILYKPYTVTSNEQYNKLDKDLLNKSPPSSSSSSSYGSSSSGSSKSKTINLTVTPSITDRVIADLKNMKKEEYLAQQRAKTTIDSDENYEAIYIDGDDDAMGDVVESNVRNFTSTDMQANIEKMPSASRMADITDDEVRVKAKPKQKTKPKSKSKPQAGTQMIGVRDKKASKKPIIITQKYKSFDETLDINDDDDYDTNMSGSGDFNNQRETDADWIAPPSIEKIKVKKMNKQERIMKGFAENAYGDEVVDIITENGAGSDGIDFLDKDDDDQVISQKIAKATATKRKQQQQKQPKSDNAAQMENQMFKPKLKSKLKSKQPLNNRQKANNKRKSKEQQYIEEYFSGTKTNSNGNSDSSAGTEAELIKV